MDSIWERLELEPTRDSAAIRRAYAQKARTCHPEEDPEGFLRLREAYQAALDYAEGQSALPAEKRQELQEDHPDAPPDAPPEAENAGWVLQEETPERSRNPYEDGEAIRQFLALYTGTQRNNPKLWMDYFTSSPFLDAAWDRSFTALLLEKVAELEPDVPPNKEFMLWLSVAYQFSVKETMEINREALRVENRTRHVQLNQGAEFDGVESILRIAAGGPVPQRPKGNAFAILQSFQDYRHLIRLAEAGRWEQEALEAYREVLNRYAPAYIRERCEQRVTPDCERHPAGLRVFLHFFQRDGLPEAVFRDAWQRLDLRNAVMGRAKILYGPLRARALEAVPGIGQEAPENFLQLNRNLDAYLAQIKADPAEEDAASAAFFASPELQKALLSPRFVEKELLTYTKWRREETGEGLTRRLLAFYREHSGIPRAGEAAAGLEEDLRRKVAKRWSLEDAQADTPSEVPALTSRPFFRHWLNTAFYTARDPETGTTLLEYLESSLPYLGPWSRRFAGKPVTASIGNVEAVFFPLHMEFRVDGTPVYRPCLTWEQTAACEDNNAFFFLLPITAASYNQFDTAFSIILDRLSSTAAPEADQALIARCLADQVCRLPLDERTSEALPPEEALPQELCAEGGGRLYTCVWHGDDGPVTLCQQTVSGRRVQRETRPEWNESALETARQMLAEAVLPTRFDLSRLRELPWNIYFTPNGGSEEHLRRPDLMGDESEEDSLEESGRASQPPLEPATEEALSSLLVRFGRDELERLELEWIQGRLVLRRDQERYACLYFEAHFGRGDYWYSLLSDPKMYQTVDCDDVVYTPFGMGTLPAYSIFDSASALMANMDQVLAQMGRGQLQAGGRGGWMWSCDVNLHDSGHKLLMAQQKLGGVPPERGRNRLLAKFLPSRHAVQVERTDLQGGKTLENLRGGSYGQAAAGLVQFMMGDLSRLRITWDYRTPEGKPYQRHLVLLRDGGRYMLLWLQDDKARADAYAAGPPARFLGYLAPACLVHPDLRRIRNCVDLLLDNIDRTEPVSDQPGEFVPVSLPYEEIRTALAGGPA